MLQTRRGSAVPWCAASACPERILAQRFNVGQASRLPLPRALHRNAGTVPPNVVEERQHRLAHAGSSGLTPITSPTLQRFVIYPHLSESRVSLPSLLPA